VAVALGTERNSALLPGASQLAASVEAGAALSPFDPAIRGRQLHASSLSLAMVDYHTLTAWIVT